MALDEAIQWLQHPEHQVAVFDATNTTPRRRQIIRDTVNNSKRKLNLIFMESICTNQKILESNYLTKVRNSPDFKGMDEKDALEDLKNRIARYQLVYRTVGDDEGSCYIKIQDLADKVTVKGIYGSIALRIVNLLMCCHNGNRPIILLRAAAAEIKEIEHTRKTALKTWTALDDSMDYIGDYMLGGEDDLAAGFGALGPYAESPSDEKSFREITRSTGTTPTIEEEQQTALPPLSIEEICRTRRLSETVRSSSREANVLPRSRRGSSSTASMRVLLRQNLRVPTITHSTSYSKVTKDGREFIKRLKAYTKTQDWAKKDSAAVFTSTLPRAIETATAFLDPNDSETQTQQWSALNVLDTGICHERAP
uniref:6-phosphofructo-2-kinase domain-containing protein n=1 Tax=Bigelowiella natans TaxID=227086 RepID=A0A7S2KFQ1_BIGNA|mmetsp:Transcript_1048/g.1627  ORF Transcript_1048/g.1627 Transcript_1048/m.1627 type:complete len:366 (+) Transcript_1048:266-1363(+)